MGGRNCFSYKVIRKKQTSAVALFFETDAIKAECFKGLPSNNEKPLTPAKLYGADI